MSSRSACSSSVTSAAARFSSRCATEEVPGISRTLGARPRVLLIPGTSSVAHLEENLAAADVTLDEQAERELTAAQG